MKALNGISGDILLHRCHSPLQFSSRTMMSNSFAFYLIVSGKTTDILEREVGRSGRFIVLTGEQEKEESWDDKFLFSIWRHGTQ